MSTTKTRTVRTKKLSFKDESRTLGQNIGVRIAKGQLTPVEGANLLTTEALGNWRVIAIASLEAAAWLTDSMEPEFRMTINLIASIGGAA